MNQLLSQDRIDVLQHYAKETEPLDGAIVEIGVYQGGSLKPIAESVLGTKRRILGFDTFTGIPFAKNEIDVHKVGDFKETSFADVAAALKPLGVEVYQGIFPDAFADVLKEIKSVSLIHSDCDVYDSCVSTLNFAAEKLLVHGVIVLDDYNWHGCPGVNKAVHEFLSKYPNFKIELIIRHQITLKRIA